MVKIRLARTGRKNLPTFKVVVTDHRSQSKSNFIEELGSYNPTTKSFVGNKERIEYWMSVGAKPTPTVHTLLFKNKLTDKAPVKVKFNTKPGKQAEERKTSKVKA